MLSYYYNARFTASIRVNLGKLVPECQLVLDLLKLEKMEVAAVVIIGLQNTCTSLAPSFSQFTPAGIPTLSTDNG